MKKIIFLLGGCMALMHTHAQKQKGFEIIGTITGKDTGKVYLESLSENKMIDSAELHNGAFTFKGKVAGPLMYNIRTANGSGALYVENTVIKATYRNDAMYQPVINGSSSDSAFREYNSRFDAYIQANMQLNRTVQKMMNENKAGTPGYAAAEDSFKVIMDHFHDMLKKFITDYPGSAVSAYVINDRLVGFGDLKLAREYMALLKPSAVNSWYGRSIQQAFDLAAKSDVGVRVSFTQTDTAGRKVKLSNIKAKYILIDFWASWCGPCRKENPNVVAAYQKYHDKGFDIIGVSLDQNKSAWLKAINKDSLTWTHVSDLKGWQNSIAVQYGIKVVPTSFLVNSEGRIVARNLRGEALHKELEKLLQ